MSTFIKYLQSLKLVVAFTVVYSCIWFIWQNLLHNDSGVLLFNCLRISFTIWAGWVMIVHSSGNLLQAAVAGAMIGLVDHVIVGGLGFLLIGEFLAIGGLVITYIMFIWVDISAGLVGGVAGNLTNYLTSKSVSPNK